MNALNNRKRFFVILFGITAIFILSWLEISLQKKQSFIGFKINKVLLFFFINLHVIILGIFLFLIIRQSIKLFVERKKKIPGSLFKKNLLFAFTIFSVLPSAFVFFIASKLITTSIDNWFEARIDTGVKNSLKLHEIQTQNLRNQLEKAGKIFYEHFCTKIDPSTLYVRSGQDAPLEQELKNLIAKHPGIKNHKFYIWKNEGAKLFGSISDEVKIWRSFKNTRDRSTKTLKKQFFNLLQNLNNEKEKTFDFYGSLYWVKTFPSEKNNKFYFILVHRYDENNRYPLIEIQNSINDYKQLKAMHNPISLNYFMTFILLTLLILFLSIWCAFYLARGISKPIQELLKAIEKVRKGNWDVKINYDPKSDLKPLSIGFNEMTTALKEAQSKLQSKNKEMLTILENIKASVFFVNKFGRILTYNSASKKLAQKYLDLNRFKNKKINFFGPQVKEIFFKLVKELIASGKNQLTKEISFTFQSEPKTLMVYLSFVENAFKTSQNGMLIVIEDLTDIVKINKIKTWQEAAKQMAHEIKNPLTPIQLATQRLQRKLKKEEKEDTTSIECTNTILHHVKIIKDLVAHFSNLSTMPASNLEPVDINKLIKEVTLLYEISYPNVKFIYEFERFLPLIKLDRKKIKRVIVNLLDNSIRAINTCFNNKNDHAMITIKTSFKKGLNQIEILIKDNGPGIPKDVKDKLFLPYVSGNKKNMGLGLAIVHDIITQLNGTIKLIPSYQGATFQILLPL